MHTGVHRHFVHRICASAFWMHAQHVLLADSQVPSHMAVAHNEALARSGDLSATSRRMRHRRSRHSLQLACQCQQCTDAPHIVKRAQASAACPLLRQQVLCARGFKPARPEAVLGQRRYLCYLPGRLKHCSPVQRVEGLVKVPLRWRSVGPGNIGLARCPLCCGRQRQMPTGNSSFTCLCNVATVPCKHPTPQRDQRLEGKQAWLRLVSPFAGSTQRIEQSCTTMYPQGYHHQARQMTGVQCDIGSSPRSIHTGSVTSLRSVAWGQPLGPGLLSNRSAVCLSSRLTTHSLCTSASCLCSTGGAALIRSYASAVAAGHAHCRVWACIAAPPSAVVVDLHLSRAAQAPAAV